MSRATGSIPLHGGHILDVSIFKSGKALQGGQVMNVQQGLKGPHTLQRNYQIMLVNVIGLGIPLAISTNLSSAPSSLFLSG